MKLFSISNLCVLIALLFFLSCKKKADITLNALESYQVVLDKKIKTIEEEQATIRVSINKNAASNQDTFELAKTLIPLRTTQFLLETKYDELTTAKKDYLSKKIEGKKAREIIRSQQHYVNDLLEETN
jgi:non-homologous end joining protein Ku